MSQDGSGGRMWGQGPGAWRPDLAPLVSRQPSPGAISGCSPRTSSPCTSCTWPLLYERPREAHEGECATRELIISWGRRSPVFLTKRVGPVAPFLFLGQRDLSCLALYFTPVSAIDCRTRGLLALAIVLVALIVAIGIGIRGLYARLRGVPVSRHIALAPLSTGNPQYPIST